MVTLLPRRSSGSQLEVNRGDSGAQKQGSSFAVVSGPISGNRGQDNPKAEVVERNRRGGTAKCRPAVLRVGVPFAAAKYTERASCSTLRIGHTAGGIRTIPILTPLPYIPDRVI